MHQQRLKPAVLFLSGCNYCMGGGFKQKYKVGVKIFSDVRVFISNGLSDAISTIAHAETVYEQMKKEWRKIDHARLFQFYLHSSKSFFAIALPSP